MFLAVDTETPVANPERQSGVDEHARIALEILLHARAPETRPPGEDLGAGAAAELRRAQHVLPGGDGLLENAGLDLAVERGSRCRIAPIRDAPLPVAEMLC